MAKFSGLILLMAFGFLRCEAQNQESSPIPLDSSIDITITQRDTSFRDNILYYFHYYDGKKIISAKFLIFCKDDSYKDAKSVTVRLRRRYGEVKLTHDGQEISFTGCKSMNGFLIIDNNEKILGNINYDLSKPDPVFGIVGKR